MKKLVALVGSLIGSILLIGSTTVFAADNNLGPIAVVNVQQVIQQSPKVAELSKKLQNQFKARQEKLDAAQKSLQAALDKFKKDAPGMSESARDAMQKKITDDRANLVKQVVAFQQDVQKEQGKAMQSIISQMNDIISSIAKKNNYSLVLNSEAVVFSNNSTDITKDVAKEFDKK